MAFKKVLVVDDSALMHRVYEVMLRDREVLHARDGVEALDLLAAHQDVGFVLLDINMPNLNGFQVLERLREQGRLPGLPVVVVTTEGHDEEAARGLAAGAAAYLTKPFRSEQIREAMARLEGAGS
jgi:two-component system chemotaxis response regulator CheY